MSEDHHPASIVGLELGVVDPDGADGPPVAVTVVGPHQGRVGPILKIQEQVAQAATPPGRGAGGTLLGLEGLIHLPPQAPAQCGQVGMVQRLPLAAAAGEAGPGGPDGMV